MIQPLKKIQGHHGISEKGFAWSIMIHHDPSGSWDGDDGRNIRIFNMIWLIWDIIFHPTYLLGCVWEWGIYMDLWDWLFHILGIAGQKEGFDQNEFWTTAYVQSWVYEFQWISCVPCIPKMLAILLFQTWTKWISTGIGRIFTVVSCRFFDGFPSNQLL